MERTGTSRSCPSRRVWRKRSVHPRPRASSSASTNTVVWPAARRQRAAQGGRAEGRGLWLNRAVSPRTLMPRNTAKCCARDAPVMHGSCCRCQQRQRPAQPVSCSARRLRRSRCAPAGPNSMTFTGGRDTRRRRACCLRPTGPDWPREHHGLGRRSGASSARRSRHLLNADTR
jgi:hypothetical protein